MFVRLIIRCTFIDFAYMRSINNQCPIKLTGAFNLTMRKKHCYPKFFFGKSSVFSPTEMLLTTNSEKRQGKISKKISCTKHINNFDSVKKLFFVFIKNYNYLTSAWLNSYSWKWLLKKLLPLISLCCLICHRFHFFCAEGIPFHFIELLYVNVDLSNAMFFLCKKLIHY